VIPAGTEERAFALTVAEDGKDSRTIAVSLEITLDPSTETSIYHREGVPGAYYYVKVRDAELTAEDKTQYTATNIAFTAFSPDENSVTTLQNALLWVDHHGVAGENGTPVGFENGTTEGYSEYRLFVKKSQQIGKFNFVGYGSTAPDSEKANISIELYGAGPFGLTPTTQQREQKITLDKNFTSGSNTQWINVYGGATGEITPIGSSGFISLTFTGYMNYNCKYKALVLGKNITIDAEKIAFASGTSNAWGAIGATYLIEINTRAMVIMNAHSKLTGYVGADSGTTKALVVVKSSSPSNAANNGRFIMYGGAITDNKVNDGVVEKKSVNTTGATLYMDGVTENYTFNGVTAKNKIKNT
jgi:hypothetical protein